GWMGEVVKNSMPEGDLRDLITDGIIAGVGGVVIFLPQILILFFFIGLMEDTGYLSRVAFIMDRLMAKVGLNGRAFIPILSSYACAVPAIMGTRTIENPKDRLITILIAPFASCSARLPVYLIMIAVMIPDVSPLWKTTFMLGLYLIGTIAIFIFAWIFNRIFRHGKRTPMIMELPGYKLPSWKTVVQHMWTRSRIFLRRAGTIILGISILLWAAETYPKMPDAEPAEQQAQSFAGRMGKAIEPVIEPLGYDWRIGIGVVASFAAREVFVSAMRITFNVEEQDDEDVTFEKTRDTLANATRDDGSPLFTPLVCLSLMMFYIFALQCASTVAIVKRETNSWRWPIFQFAYMTAVAYLAALIVYQGGKLLGFS
ncbi:MAG: ferrous iron transporter B, partial [Verrucomicrobiales bacterium]|nr:ferrous iron transporter B [Verrucomicrobiales bacterium]